MLVGVTETDKDTETEVEGEDERDDDIVVLMLSLQVAVPESERVPLFETLMEFVDDRDNDDTHVIVVECDVEFVTSRVPLSVPDKVALRVFV